MTGGRRNTGRKRAGHTRRVRSGSVRAEIQMPDSDSDSDADEMLQYKVILLGDEEYEPDPVCDVLVKVIPDIENVVQAKDKYEEAMGPVGKSLLMICPKEHAEGYAEQLIRADPEMMVFAEIEEE